MHFQVKRTPIKGMFELGELDHIFPPKETLFLGLGGILGKMRSSIASRYDFNLYLENNVLKLLKFVKFNPIYDASYLNPATFVWHTDGWKRECTNYMIMCVCSNSNSGETLFSNQPENDSLKDNYPVDMIGQPYHVYLIPRFIVHKGPRVTYDRYMYRYFIKLTDEQINLLEEVK